MEPAPCPEAGLSKLAVMASSRTLKGEITLEHAASRTWLSILLGCLNSWRHKDADQAKLDQFYAKVLVPVLDLGAISIQKTWLLELQLCLHLLFNNHLARTVRDYDFEHVVHCIERANIFRSQEHCQTYATRCLGSLIATQHLCPKIKHLLIVIADIHGETQPISYPEINTNPTSEH